MKLIRRSIFYYMLICNFIISLSRVIFNKLLNNGIYIIVIRKNVQYPSPPDRKCSLGKTSSKQLKRSRSTQEHKNISHSNSKFHFGRRPQTILNVNGRPNNTRAVTVERMADVRSLGFN